MVLQFLLLMGGTVLIGAATAWIIAKVQIERKKNGLD